MIDYNYTFSHKIQTGKILQTTKKIDIYGILSGSGRGGVR